MPRRDVLWRFALRFVLYFLPLALLWLFIAPLYTQLIFAGANLLFALERPAIAQVAPQGEGLYAYQLTASGPVPVFGFEMYGLFFNVMLLVALLLATPEMRLLSRLRALAFALPLMAAIHMLFIVIHVRAQFINLGLLASSPVAAYGHNWLAVLLGTLGEGLFPLLIAGGLSWRAWQRALSLDGPYKRYAKMSRHPRLRKVI